MTKTFAQRSPIGGADARGVRTRERILEAAAVLIVERGWGATTTRAVAARAEVNPALVHYHFGAKQAVLRLAAERALERELAQPIESVTRSSSLADGIRALAGWLRGLDAGSPISVLSAEVLARATRDPDLRGWMASMLAEYRTAMAGAIRGLQARGALDATIDSTGVAILVAALLDGLVFHRLIDPTVDLELAADALESCVRGAA